MRLTLCKPAGGEEDGGGRLLRGSRLDLLPTHQHPIKELLRLHPPQLPALDLWVPAWDTGLLSWQLALREVI